MTCSILHPFGFAQDKLYILIFDILILQ